jgi:hypothetical protein
MPTDSTNAAIETTGQPPDDDPELRKLRLERERLQLKKENAALRAEIASVTAPWWRSARTVTTLTAIIALVLPASTFVRESVQKSRELALARQKQDDQIRSAYLDRMKTPGEHIRTLDFVLATSEDPKLKVWATAEKVRLQPELKKAEDDKAAMDDELKKARDQYLDALRKDTDFSRISRLKDAFELLNGGDKKANDVVSWYAHQQSTFPNVLAMNHSPDLATP